MKYIKTFKKIYLTILVVALFILRQLVFYEGLMDDGSEFGYVVEVVSIDTDENGEKTATIRVTAK